MCVQLGVILGALLSTCVAQEATCTARADDNDHCTLLQSNIGVSSVGGAQLQTNRFEITPTSIHLADIQSEPLDTQGMHEKSLLVPGTNETVSIFIYEASDDAAVSNSIAKGHPWERAHVRKLLDLWQSGFAGNFLDVGGNIGTFVLPIAHKIAQLGAKAVTIEGMPGIAAHLRAGIQANHLDNVALYEYAVGGPDAGNYVQMAENPENKGGSAVVGNKPFTLTGQVHGRRAKLSQVKLTTIDAILDSDPSLQKLLAMKMDIEGNEGRALKGATKLLEKYPPCYLMIELIPAWLASAGTPCKFVKQQLHVAGYNVSSLCERMDTYFLAQRDMQKCLTRCGDFDSQMLDAPGNFLQGSDAKQSF